VEGLPRRARSPPPIARLTPGRRSGAAATSVRCWTHGGADRSADRVGTGPES
jgi:hypothetical protein